MKLNIRDLLEYFDIKKSTEKGDVTATISVVGEDLGAALFRHYCEKEHGSIVKIIDANKEIPKTGATNSKWLDRWIVENNKGKQTLFQTEIKSWCSRSVGGLNVPIDISEHDLLESVRRNWKENVSEIDDSKENRLNKVLIKMNKGDGDIKGAYKQEPLLIFWDARNPSNGIDCFNRYDIKPKYFDFDYCWVFSCSLYLRELYGKGEREFNVDIPNAERRLTDLFRIFKIK